jgi:magnesium chelatase family protein
MLRVPPLSRRPAAVIVGLPDAVMKETKDGVRSASHNSGYRYHDGPVTVNLAPTDIKKDGANFDLPIE